MTVKTPAERIEALRHNLHIATDLFGPDCTSLRQEYTGAISEFTCIASGISTSHKEAVTDLTVELACTPYPDANIDTFAHALETMTILVGTEPPMERHHPEYVRGLIGYACITANLVGEYGEGLDPIVTAVHGVLIGVLTNE